MMFKTEELTLLGVKDRSFKDKADNREVKYYVATLADGGDVYEFGTSEEAYADLKEVRNKGGVATVRVSLRRKQGRGYPALHLEKFEYES
jgi:hypothetical protein